MLDIAEAAASEPCGRAWIDLQRYAWRACYELAYAEVCNAIVSGMKALLTDITSLLDSTLDDDTPTANAETKQWIADYVLPPQPTAPGEEQEYSPEPAFEESTEQNSGSSEPDVCQAASERADAGDLEAAIEMLMREAERERAGRRRFQRRAQLAQICLAHGQERVAYPILQGLAQAMDERRLEEWEDAEMLAQPLLLLFRCIDRLDKKSEEKQAIYTRLCRLSPRLALACK